MISKHQPNKKLQPYGWSVALLAAAACLASLWLRGYSYSNSYWYGYLAGSACGAVFLLCCHWNIFIGY